MSAALESAHLNSMVRDRKGHSLLAFPSRYVVLDLETTGLDPQYDDIIEVAAIRIVDGAIEDSFSSLVNPGYSIDEFIAELTGITDDMLAPAPSLDSVLPAFLSFIGSDVVVGHNVNFDINFIYDSCSALSLEPFSNDFVDTMRISRKLFPEDRHHILKILSADLGLTNLSRIAPFLMLSKPTSAIVTCATMFPNTVFLWNSTTSRGGPGILFRKLIILTNRLRFSARSSCSPARWIRCREKLPCSWS